MQYKLFWCIINLQFFYKWGVYLRIKDGFELENRSGINVVVRKNENSGAPFNTITLTETTVFLWNLLKEKDVTKTEMLGALIENFEISTVLALGNIDVFVRTMKENGIIEE